MLLCREAQYRLRFRSSIIMCVIRFVNITLTKISPRNSVTNSGNAFRASWAFTLMWIFKAETSTITTITTVNTFAKWLTPILHDTRFFLYKGNQIAYKCFFFFLVGIAESDFAYCDMLPSRDLSVCIRYDTIFTLNKKPACYRKH